MLYLTDPWYLPFQLLKKTESRDKENYVQIVNGFYTWKPWTPTSETIYATNLEKSKKQDPNAVFYGPPVFYIPTQEKNIN